MTQESLIQVHQLEKKYKTKEKMFSKNNEYIKAVDNVTFHIKEGETFGLVGESGSGKSTIGKSILRLQDISNGEIKYHGKNVFELDKKEMRHLRTKMQFVFQDPFSSLNPRLRIGDALAEPLLDHGLATKKNVKEKVMETMELCGLPTYHINKYPHEFSGGQRQRIGIARAMIMNPEFIVADEPVSALDVSIQAQIINLFQELQEKRNLSYLFISHDLSVVEHLCSRIGVLYLGTMMELASRDQLYENPQHPYTKALLSAVPIPDPTKRRERILLKGDLPNPASPPSGCKFHTRCPFAMDICKNETPVFKEREPGHFVACHLVDQEKANT
ncbi:ABC transporter ATP-binding protein [Oceanobacillus oncorhynchi subsp. incaldanensis]|uniref:Oligopeptide transport ATP-binding protein OppF n=2 Tax=Oceanobacillus TaxID=182709 RepID=A0A0A1MX84_9BACI|nr:ABC transporter ATP-binding protein [Oceanobacillus oncorhynchi]MDM8099650.1 ABC transporter ATP-binding protein [Oceanobacillus oncorhynchi]UUI41897.1 ABC transporter ATP-binding protein [Oceanobacillus oncorhynchi]GIO19949.1 ABC transporter ATP-binding protein [Oceanobacillus oncorhynchi subsp. incaldanensis]CEI83401.1 Oligopeptide transport ATP-binding protein OppF [Oceanobacillus oncorhynchi]